MSGDRSTERASSGSLRDLLIRVDSVTSEVAHRHAGGIPDDVRRDLSAVSAECRKLADTANDHDSLAVLLAEHWWPSRYLGDLSEADWKRVYNAIEKPS